MMMAPLIENTKGYQIINKLYIFFVLILFFWWMCTTTYFAVTVPIGNPPDEFFHIQLSKSYEQLTTFILKDNINTVSMGIVGKSPNLYHLILGKFTHISNSDYLLLRGINVFIGLLFFIFCFKVISCHSSDKLVKLLFLFLVSNTIMLQYLFGAVSYDNLVNLLAITSFYFFYRVIERNDIKVIKWLIIISLLGILTKLTYLPLFIIQIIIIIYNLIKTKQFSILYKDIIHNKIVVLIILFLFFVFSYFYIGNIIRYHNLVPSCSQVLEQYICQKDASTIENEKLMLSVKMRPTFSNLYSYSFSWIRLMNERTYGVFSHKSMLPDTEWISFITIAGILSFIIIFKLINNKYDYYLFYISLFYSLTVFNNNYSGYLSTGINHVAVQGRYLFPVIFPIYYLLSKYLFRIYNKQFFKCIIFILILTIFIKYSYFYFVSIKDISKLL